MQNPSKIKARLPTLIEAARSDEEVIIRTAGKPATRMAGYDGEAARRKPGTLLGQIRIADDFDDLPADISEDFGVE